MEIVRKYKKLSTLRFLELVELELDQPLKSEDFYAFFDELKMRKLESISEGEIFKIRKTAKGLLEVLEQSEMAENELLNLRKLANQI